MGGIYFLLLENKNVHIAFLDPIPVTKFCNLLKQFTSRGYEYVHFDKLDSLDPSELSGDDSAIFQMIKEWTVKKENRMEM